MSGDNDEDTLAPPPPEGVAGTSPGGQADGPLLASADHRAVDLLRGAIEIPSPSGEEAAVAAYLVEAMEARGLTASVDEVGNAVGRIGAGPTRLLFLGHIDTVPGVVPVRQDGDRLYGRGSVDATGPFCAFVEAVGRLGAELGDRLSITVAGAVEEEVASSRGAHHVLAHHEADLVVVGEPSGWDAVTLGYKGRLGLTYTVRQPMAHGAGADPSAADRGLAFWGRMKGWAEAFNTGKKIFGSLDMKVVRCRTDEDPLEDRFELRADLRTPVAFPLAGFRAACAKVAQDEGGQVEIVGEVEAIRAPKNTPLVRAFLKGIRARGGKPRFKVKTGTADMNLVPRYLGDVPVLTYGPGDSALDHTPDEHILLTEYLEGIAVLEEALRKLAA